MQKKKDALSARTRYQARRRTAGGARPPAELSERALFEHVFEAAPDGNILVDEAGRIVLANQQAEAMFGFRPGELLGQPVEALVPEAQRPAHSSRRETYTAHPTPRPMAERKAALLELTGRRKDGSLFPVEITLSPIHAGAKLYVLSVVRDVTPRVMAEQSAARQEALVRLLQEIAVAANEAESISAAFQFALNRLCQHLKWPVGHAFLADEDAALSPTQIWCGGTLRRYASFITASEAIRFRAGVGLPGLALEGAAPVWMTGLLEHPAFVRKDAAREAGLNTGLALPVIAGKQVVGVLEFFHPDRIPADPSLMAVLPHIGMQIGRVVERKRAEDALRRQAMQMRMIINNLPVILWVVDRTGRLILLEGTGVARAGLQAAELLGKNVFEQFAHRPDLSGYVRRALAGEEIHAEVASSEGATFETYFMPYYDVNWAVDGMIGLSFDVSDRKRMERDLEEMQRRLLESADAERARLAQQLHDGPLQDLYGAFYQIQEVSVGLVNGEQEIAGRALATIQNVSSALRVIVGELHPNTLVHLGLQRAIRAHADRWQERLDETRVTLDLADDTAPENALPHALRLWLYRVFQQLFANAVRHSQARHIWARLIIQPGEVILEVQDNGRGFEMPEQWLELLRRNQYGLVSALERVRSMGGALEVETRPNAGTLARARVPRG